MEKDGSITNVKILRGIDPELNKEAVRVISAMPKWKPGTQKGEAVRVKYTVPVMFRLTENNTQVKYAPIESKIDEMVVVGYAPEEATYPEKVTVFEVVEKMPEYPGGMSAMMEFIGKNIKYSANGHRQHRSAQKDAKTVRPKRAGNRKRQIYP